MKGIPKHPLALAAGALSLLAAALQAAPASAATITVDNSNCTLVQAVNAANLANGGTATAEGTGQCAAGSSGSNTLVIPPNNPLSFGAAASTDASLGNSALPAITSAVTIVGNNNTVSATASGFRFVLINAASASLTLDGLTVTGFSMLAGGTPAGAAIWCRAGGLTLTNSTLKANTVPAFGGALYNSCANTSITNSTISGNTAVAGGGGISNTGSSLVISNSTISGNTANATQGVSGGFLLGGGIKIEAGSATLKNVTLTGNTAKAAIAGMNVMGGGIYAAGSLTLQNTLIAGNSAQCGAINPCGNELVRENTSVTANANNLFGHAGEQQNAAFGNYIYPSTFTAGAAGFSPGLTDYNATNGGSAGTLLLLKSLTSILNTTLADNGGPTQTHALPAGSPAINTGNASALANDQRGYVKASGDTVRDIGAYEYNGVPLPTVTGLNPATGPDTGGTTVIITGTGFLGSTSVNFGSKSASFATNSATQITATSPSGSLGSVDVTVTNANGTSVTSSADQFTYIQGNVDGACGMASGVSSSTAPAANLCATGTATAVSGSSTAWTWGCNGSGSGTSTAATACAANYPKPTLTLNAVASSIKVGDGTLVEASSNNGLPPALSVSTTSVCSLGTPVGNSAVTATVTGTAQGSCTVATNQPAVTSGTTRYLAADEKTLNITVSKKDQSIGTPGVSPNTILVGNTSTVSATASSGLPVSYSASPSTVCTNSGGTITGVGAGNCTVTVSQAGDSTYNAALGQFASITVQAVPVNGACGSASGGSSASAPSANLCSTGSASLVSGSNGAWGWTCMGENGGTASNACAAPYASQTLSLSATPTSIEAGRTASILASSNSNLTVSLSASGAPANACTLSGTTLNGVNEGSCTVTASQAGTGDSGTQRYLAATPVSTTVTITQSTTSACEAYRSRAGAKVIDLTSSPGGQTVRGDAAKFNVIFGSAFNDTITGGNAGNCIDGGAGNDRLTAGSGENYLYGQNGNDQLTPGTGSTLMDGGAGTDKCVLASGRSTATYASCESN